MTGRPVDSGAFGGRIGRTLADSEHWFAEPAHPGDGAPNVVVVLLDDTGFGHLSCFGGLVETPNLDALAGDGLRYNNMHTTALCSPSRVCMITGRNHHSNNMA